jgi:hypothetical protein
LYLALLVPLAYRPPSVTHAVPAYDNTRQRLDAICASQRLRLPFSLWGSYNQCLRLAIEPLLKRVPAVMGTRWTPAVRRALRVVGWH